MFGPGAKFPPFPGAIAPGFAPVLPIIRPAGCGPCATNGLPPSGLGPGPRPVGLVSPMGPGHGGPGPGPGGPGPGPGGSGPGPGGPGPGPGGSGPGPAVPAGPGVASGGNKPQDVLLLIRQGVAKQDRTAVKRLDSFWRSTLMV